MRTWERVATRASFAGEFLRSRVRHGPSRVMVGLSVFRDCACGVEWRVVIDDSDDCSMPTFLAYPGCIQVGSSRLKCWYAPHLGRVT